MDKIIYCDNKVGRIIFIIVWLEKGTSNCLKLPTPVWEDAIFLPMFIAFLKLLSLIFPFLIVIFLAVGWKKTTSGLTVFHRTIIVSFHMAMNQYLLIPFLVGWTSIYQLFWGSLGTRVLTHPHMFPHFVSHEIAILLGVESCRVRCKWPIGGR